LCPWRRASQSGGVMSLAKSYGWWSGLSPCIIAGSSCSPVLLSPRITSGGVCPWGVSVREVRGASVLGLGFWD
ncbi:hypothetical protein, partial [Moraxella nonliquefaciens]|uniref:hypothetical protein n=1 Tax=Moraxella nonliquefaciens TaxID=478 RepID=UPI00155F6FCE